MEIIEIGAVALATSDGPVMGEYSAFVRPVVEPVLSDFCTRLTGVRQSDVDLAEPFPAVFPAFLQWTGLDPFTFCSWGAYDLYQFRTDCTRHEIQFPRTLELHIKLKQTFARLQGIKPCGMKAALRQLNLPLEGQHHRALDDARNIAKIARVVLPRTEL